jgi:hypothetical protein
MTGSEARREIADGGWVRLGLSLLAAPVLAVGAWALVIPRSFHEDFPAAGRGWVSALGPYNEHLVRDVGALNLALGTLLALAAILPGLRLTRVALGAWLVYALPHFVFHATELEALSALDNAVNLITLGLAVVLPLVILGWTAANRGGPEKGGAR